MYLQKTDYTSRINLDLLNQIIDTPENIEENVLETIDRIATDTIGTYAGVLYATAAEWAKTGLNRNFLLFKWALDIAVYEGFMRIDDEQIPEKHIKNYNDCMEDLAKVATGKLPLNLPPKENDTIPDGGDTDTQGTGLRRIGYTKKRTHTV